jgi:hypothetical protein
MQKVLNQEGKSKMSEELIQSLAALGRQINREQGKGRDEERDCWPFVHATVIRPP